MVPKHTLDTSRLELPSLPNRMAADATLLSLLPSVLLAPRSSTANARDS